MWKKSVLQAGSDLNWEAASPAGAERCLSAGEFPSDPSTHSPQTQCFGTLAPNTNVWV